MLFAGLIGSLRPNNSKELSSNDASADIAQSNDNDYDNVNSQEVETILNLRNKSMHLGVFKELIPENQVLEPHGSESSLEEKRQEMKSIVTNQSPLERLRFIYNLDQSLPDHPLSQMRRWFTKLPLYGGCFFGLYSAMQNVPIAMDAFLRKHKTTTWLTTEMAKRRLSDTMIYQSLSFGIVRGVRLYAMAYTCLMGPFYFQACRGYSSFWDYGAIWGTVFPLFFLGQGPRFMLLIGSTMGLIGLGAGSLVYSLSYIMDGRFDFGNLYSDYLHQSMIHSSACMASGSSNVNPSSPTSSPSESISASKVG